MSRGEERAEDLRDVLPGRSGHQQAEENRLELADVSGPIVALERLDRFSGERQGRRELEPAGLLLDEVARELEDVLPAIAERRQVEPNASEPMVEVPSEGALGDVRLQVLARRGEDADVDAPRIEAAEASHHGLHDAQELCLRLEGKGRHLVQEKRPVVNMLEKTRAGLLRARERPGLVTEELRLTCPYQ